MHTEPYMEILTGREHLMRIQTGLNSLQVQWETFIFILPVKNVKVPERERDFMNS
jgi:hypothetical protein